MRRYETVFILRPSLNEKQIDTVVDMCSGQISDVDGKIIELNRWGMRKLAYPIKKDMQGFYVLIDYVTTPEVVTEIERRFRIDDGVLRYMTLKTADEITEEEIVAAIEAASNRKLAAESEEESSEDEDDLDDDDDEIDDSEEDTEE